MAGSAGAPLLDAARAQPSGHAALCTDPDALASPNQSSTQAYGLNIDDYQHHRVKLGPSRADPSRLVQAGWIALRSMSRSIRPSAITRPSSMTTGTRQS